MSLTVSHGLLYVLNSGEEDRLFTGPESFIEKCTTGQLPSVTGFRIGAGGGLTQIHGSTRVLGGGRDSGCSQVQFAPDGRTHVVSERRRGKKTDDGTAKGGFSTFPVPAS